MLHGTNNVDEIVGQRDLTLEVQSVKAHWVEDMQDSINAFNPILWQYTWALALVQLIYFSIKAVIKTYFLYQFPLLAPPSPLPSVGVI